MSSALAATTPDTAPPTVESHRPTWLRHYQVALVVLDGVVLAASVTAAVALRFPDRREDLHGVSYFAVAAAVGLLWWVALALTRSYEARYLSEGPEEFHRVAQAAIRVAASLGIACYLMKLPLSRGFVVTVLPLAASSLLLGRWGARRVLKSRRHAGHWNHRVVVVGAAERVDELLLELQRTPDAGLEVVAVCLADDGLDLTEVERAVRSTRADSVAITSWPGMSPAALRDLSYAVEGSKVDLLVAPSLVNVSGSRVNIRPVAGLPLLELRETELSGPARLVKASVDRFFAAVLLALLCPVLVVAAVLIRLGGDGPVVVRRRRLGPEGSSFDQLWLRTRRAPPSPGAGGPHQRWTDQPMTPVGAVLDRLLIDDLPQLLNILRGEMSFVGPRPMSPGLRQNDTVAKRRMLVRPGLTGLAQVSGRTDTSAAESFRLDQQYVDNWSIGLDVLIVFRTVLRVLAGGRLSRAHTR
ncbi:MAG: sugar transferase [Actinomycetota bacterium]|nr:sugar transferase [Actinomycetota bacterium]